MELPFPAKIDLGCDWIGSVGQTPLWQVRPCSAAVRNNCTRVDTTTRQKTATSTSNMSL